MGRVSRDAARFRPKAAYGGEEGHSANVRHRQAMADNFRGFRCVSWSG